MTNTANLGLPCIEGSQAQKHVTHNDALRILDTLVQLAVLDRDLSAPPASPTEGKRWIVKAGATGLWAGHDHAIAAWQDGGWQYCVPQAGWVAFVIDEGALVVWDGFAWGDYFSTVTSIQNLALLGVGTTADATNPLSAKLNNALFSAKTVAEGGDGHLRYKLSKESASKTLSFLFQNNWSGRAEIGLTGDDDFHFKVSPDGSSWHEGIVIDRATGAVSFPNSTIVGGREVLTANRIYYVRTDGNDSNNGFDDSAGGAFLTIQKAVDAVAALDLSIYNVIIQVRSGTYTQPIELKSLVGTGMVTLQGDNVTPSNCLISVTAADCITANGVRRWRLSGFKTVTTTSGSHICGTNGTNVTIGAWDFGAAAGNSVHASVSGSGSAFSFDTNYTISGAAGRHWLGSMNATLLCTGLMITLSGTPAFTLFFAQAARGGILFVSGNTFSGGATGTRYYVASGALIDTGGVGNTYLPGDSAGTGTNYAATPYGLYA